MKKAFITKLWTLWNTPNVFDNVEEYAAMAEGLMTERGIRFENDDVKEWFYETINSPSTKNIREFTVAGMMALDFSQCIHNVES